MKKIIEWLFATNRMAHFTLGILVGLGAEDWYCAEYVGAGVSGSLEFKDVQHGGKWDWIDFAFTFAGVNIGYLIRFLIGKL